MVDVYILLFILSEPGDLLSATVHTLNACGGVCGSANGRPLFETSCFLFVVVVLVVEVVVVIQQREQQLR